MPAEVSVIEPVGSEMIVHACCWEEQTIVVRCEVNPDLDIGQRVWLEPSREKALFFDRETEESLSFRGTRNRLEKDGILEIPGTYPKGKKV